MHARIVAPLAALTLALAACASKEGQMAMGHIETTDQGVAVKTPELPPVGAKNVAVPTVQKPSLALEQMTPSSGYKSDKCLVSDEPLGATKVAYSYGGQEVQFCCPACAAKFMQSPDTYLAKLANASK